MAAEEWDLFCRVVDNLGDVGVCWRLAADLAARGQPVRLWIDDASALAWMAPGGAPGVSVHAWPTGDVARHAGLTVDAPAGDRPRFAPGPVVIEAFGCELPPGVLAAMAARPEPPVWIDLEYLSAEVYVERSHRLPSPQTTGPGAGLVRHFFYPGFSEATGGLIREPALAAAQAAFDAAEWLRRFGLERRPGERLVSLFCYPQPALPALLQALAEAPTVLLLTPGAAERQVLQWLAHAPPCPRLRTRSLPWLSQADYDRLLWSCDLNLVRGEDSFVRAQWAGAPFVWQAYPQAQDGHRVKVQAFLQRHLAGVDDAVGAPIRQVWSAWNGGPAAMPRVLPPAPAWRQVCLGWRAGLQGQTDLVSRLRQFVAERATGNG